MEKCGVIKSIRLMNVLLLLLISKQKAICKNTNVHVYKQFAKLWCVGLSVY